MRKLTLVLCIICLLVPTMSKAEQPCYPCLATMLEEGILTEEEWQPLMAGDWNEEEIRALIAEHQEITPSQDINSYLCYYLAYSAIMDFVNCLQYFYFTPYFCTSAIFLSLAYSYFCT